MGVLAGAISAAQAKMTITVKRTGRVRPPNLPDPQLKKIGEAMVAHQKERWAKHGNAAGQQALKLSVRWAIIKQAVLHKRAYRDMTFSGRTVKNFQLRKAADGRIRAENTTRKERDKASGCNKIDQMIGFSLEDTKVCIDDVKAEFGSYVKTAWIPVEGTNRRPASMGRTVRTP